MYMYCRSEIIGKGFRLKYYFFGFNDMFVFVVKSLACFTLNIKKFTCKKHFQAQLVKYFDFLTKTFFPKFELPNSKCSLSGRTSYLPVFTVVVTRPSGVAIQRLCSYRKYPYPPHGRLMAIQRGGGGGVQKPNVLNESMTLKWNFVRGQFEKPSMGRVWIFSGTTH